MRQLGVSVLINAMLGNGYRSAVGQAIQGIGGIHRAANDLQGALMDIGQATAGAYALGTQVKAAGDLEHQLARIGVTADMNAEQVEALRQRLRQLSNVGETNQSVDNLLKAYRALVSSGLDSDTALASLRDIGRTATASGAEIDALAKTAFVLIDTLGIKPEGLGTELNRLTAAGKDGSFEMENMARHFPVLAAGAKEAGLVGSEAVGTLAASLQMAVKGAGEAGEAANNVKNFFSKMLSTETIKNFEKAGVNVVKIFGDALKKGENPVEVMLRQIDKMLGNDVATRKKRLAALFGDEQVKDFIRPMLANMKHYTDLKAAIMDDAKVAGVVNKDYATMLETFNEKAQGAANAASKFGTTIGKSWLGPLGMVSDAAVPMVTWLSDLADKSPSATFAVTALGTAVMVLPGLFRAATLATKLFGGTVMIMGRAIAVTPIGALVTALAVGAGVVYDHWEPIKGFFLGIWDGVTAKWQEFADFVTRIWTTISEPINKALAFAGSSFSAATDRAPQNSPPTRGGSGIGAAARDRSNLGRAAAATGAGTVSGGKVDINVNMPNLPRGAQVETNATGNVGDVFTKTGTQMVLP